MKKFSRAYLLIAGFAVAGCVFLLLDHSEYDVADAFRNAAQCADTSSPGCYQLYPGVIQAVRVANTSSGEQDAVDIASRGSNIHVSLLPSVADASLVQAGAPVSVEWYVGSVVTVWIGGHAVPSTSSPGTHANFAYIGWMLVWLAALFWAVLLVNRRVSALFAAVRILPARAEVQALSNREAILPGGTTGWVVKPRAQQTFLLPVLLGALALISARPLINPDFRLVAVVGDALLFGSIAVRLALTLRNGRVMADRASISTEDWLGRVRSWPLADIEQAAILGIRWSDWAVPSVWFVGRDGGVLFGVTSVYWNLDEIGALCVSLGVPLTFDYVPKRTRRVNRLRAVMNFIGVLITGALLVISFLPLPSGRG
jgi:hypothetical protein